MGRGKRTHVKSPMPSSKSPFPNQQLARISLASDSFGLTSRTDVADEIQASHWFCFEDRRAAAREDSAVLMEASCGKEEGERGSISCCCSPHEEWGG
jgi:hypothetical protein